MSPPDRSEGHALAFHALFAAVAVAVLAVPVATLGARIFALVLGHNFALPVVARLLGHREWLSLWLFLLPLSAFQVVPDWVLSAVLGVLVFPDVGGPRIDTVNGSMAGIWTIALFPVVLLGQQIEARIGRRAALVDGLCDRNGSQNHDGRAESRRTAGRRGRTGWNRPGATPLYPPPAPGRTKEMSLNSRELSLTPIRATHRRPVEPKSFWHLMARRISR